MINYEQNKSIETPNLMVQDVLYECVRQLITEILQVINTTEQAIYIHRVYEWFRRRKETYNLEAIPKSIRESKDQPKKIHKPKRGKRTIHLGTKSPDKRLERLYTKSQKSRKVSRVPSESVSPLARVVVNEPQERSLSPVNLKVRLENFIYFRSKIKAVCYPLKLRKHRVL